MEKCASCSTELTGPYCSACGEKKLSGHDLSVGHFVSHSLHDIAHFDTKVFGSLLPLLLKPGFLTAEFMAGRWKSYIKPTTLFVMINLFFFFAHGGVMNWNADEYIKAAGAERLVERRAQKRGISLETYKEHFTEVARERQHLTFFFAIPVVALILLAVFRRRFFVEHLVYSIHFHAWALLFLTVGLRLLIGVLLRPLVWLGQSAPVEFLAREPGLNYLVGLSLAAYQVPALRRVYGTSWLASFSLATLLVVGESVFILYAFQPLVFYWVYYTT